MYFTLNGMSVLNYRGDYSHIFQTDCSLVDYFATSTSMREITRFSVLSTTESTHLTVELSTSATNTDVAVIGTVSHVFSFVKYKWNEEKSISFSCMMQTEHIQALLNEAASLIVRDIIQAPSKFTE